MDGDSLMEAMEKITQVIEMTSGYRSKCEAAGFSPSASEQMALDFHHYVLITMSNMTYASKE